MIPTGIDLDLFGSGDGAAFRRQYDIPPSALVVGHVGRLAGEKNLDYLARAVGQYLARSPRRGVPRRRLGRSGRTDSRNGVAKWLAPNSIIMTGSQTGQDLADAYAAMDVFVFSSQSETQGMVLAEAMAARTPVVALDGPGVRDVLGHANGRLLPADASAEAFAAALADVSQDRGLLSGARPTARQSIRDYGLEVCADRLVALYRQLIEQHPDTGAADPGPWDRLLRRLEIEWNLLVEKTAALRAAVAETEVTRMRLN